MKLFVSPHNDDAVLFGASTLMRERPVVLTVLDSYLQPQRGHFQCSAEIRRREDEAAIGRVLGRGLLFGGISDALPLLEMKAKVLNLFREFAVTEIWLPAVEEGGNDHHNLIGMVGQLEFAGRAGILIHEYLTYTDRGKSTRGVQVKCNGAMVRKKLEALACYRTQLEIDELGCWPHFLRDQSEYLVVS